MPSGGLGAREAAKFRIRALEVKRVMTKGKKEKKKVEALLGEAIDAEMDLLVEEGGDGDFAGMELDDDEDEGWSGDDESDDVREETGSVVSSRSKGMGKARAMHEGSNEGEEPSSFSRIPTSLLHPHLSLPTTATSADSETSTKIDLSKATMPFVVEIDPGRCLTSPLRGGMKSPFPPPITARVTFTWRSITGTTLLTGWRISRSLIEMKSSGGTREVGLMEPLVARKLHNNLHPRRGRGCGWGQQESKEGEELMIR